MRRHVIIGGTGRAGTSFIVELLTRLGVDTGFKPTSLKLHPLSRAGLEFDICKSNAPYVVKSPALSRRLRGALQRGDVIIEHAFVPIRAFADVAASRSRVHRLAGGQAPGGLWLTDDPARQIQVLDRQFAMLFETLARNDIPVTLLWFPRLVQDCDYLFARLQYLLDGIDLATFRTAFEAIVRPEWVHDFEQSVGAE